MSPSAVPDPARSAAGTSHPVDGREIIANVIRELLQARCGRSPRKATVQLSRGLVIVLLEDCLTVGENSLMAAGKGALVDQTRATLHEAIRIPASASVAQTVGAPVVAYLASQHHDPDVAVLAFVLGRHN